MLNNMIRATTLAVASAGLLACAEAFTPSPCGVGESVQVNGASFCVYKEAIVIVGGFDCPASMRFRMDFDNATVCGSQGFDDVDVPNDICARVFVPCTEEPVDVTELDGGIGGSGGSGACQTNNDIRTGAQCAAEAEGWFAVKTTLDVWWPSTANGPAVDPGRGNIETYALVRVDGLCADGSNGVAATKLCGLTLPPMTSDTTCDAIQFELPDALWDSPSMPRFITTANITTFAPGGRLNLSAATSLFGIDLQDGSENGPWPSSNMTGTFACEAGMGANCFPDHDNDGVPGITAHVRTDGAAYTSQYGDGLCTSGVAYQYRGASASLDVGFGVGIRVQEIALGMRTVLQGGGQVGSDCSSGAGSVDAATVESRAWDCSIDPSTLPQGDVARSACSPAEAQFIDDNLPTYQALQAGQVPGDTRPPLGWAFEGREIDKSPSVGPRSAFVRLAALRDVEPSCAEVRNAAYPSL